MAMYTPTSTLVNAMDEETMEFQAPPARKIKRNHWIGITVVVMGVMGLVGFSQTVAKPTTPFEHITMAQHKFMSVFSARALKAASILDTKAKFKGSLELLINQDGQNDPSAMCVDAALSRNKGSKQAKTPKAIITFVSKAGKASDLKDKLQDIWDSAASMEEKDDRKEMKKAVQIEYGGDIPDDRVSFTMKMPDDIDYDKETDDMEDAFDEMSPKLTASLCFGRTIEEMYANKATDNVIELPKGVEAKIGAKFASLLFQAAGDSAPPPVANMMTMMKGVASFKGREEILYQNKDELQDAFGSVPTLEEEITQMQRMVQHGPKELTQHLQGLHDLCDGVERMQATGLPLKYELDVTFKNFHPSAVLASMAQGASQGGKHVHPPQDN